MYIKRFLVSVVCSLTGILIQGALAQTPSALTGLVTCSEEGPMEGVVVSAKKDGSTISVSVITNAEGRFAFPATRLEAGLYTCLLYTSPSPRDRQKSRMPSSA